MGKGMRQAAGLLVLLGIAGFCSAQRGGGGFGGGGFGRGGGGGFGRGGGASDSYNGASYGGALPMPDLPEDRHGVPKWDVDPQFKHDVFTFVRLHYYSSYSPMANGMSRSGGTWLTDFPDSDLNLPFRLQQMTSLKVDPESKCVNITDDALFDFPFAYMLEVGHLEFTDEEITALRRYLLNGGFLMIDDHWGLNEQENFREQIARVFPDRPLQELGLEHPIFHTVFDLKTKPQVPGISAWRRSGGQTYERADDPLPHYRAMYDDHGRMMLFECANTDFGDGWEREGVNEQYFHLFSERQAYPMAINIIVYAMTH